jgi:hypothetical protein
LGFVQGGRISDALAALFRGKGIDEEMRRADQALVHGRGGLHGQQFIPQGGVNTASKLRQRFRQDKVLLRTIKVHFYKATGIHDGHVSAQPLADGFIGGAHFVFEQRQGQQEARWDRRATTLGALREAAGNASLNSCDQLGPGKRISPPTDGIGVGNDSGNLEPGAAPAEPMLQVA